MYDYRSLCRNKDEWTTEDVFYNVTEGDISRVAQRYEENVWSVPSKCNLLHSSLELKRTIYYRQNVYLCICVISLYLFMLITMHEKNTTNKKEGICSWKGSSDGVKAILLVIFFISCSVFFIFFFFFCCTNSCWFFSTAF